MPLGGTNRLSPALPRGLRLGLLLAFFAMGIARAGAAQEGVTATSGSPEAITRIREEFARTEREASGYRRTTRELHGFSLEGGELHGFYRGSELRKLAARHYGESGQTTEEYYFADGRLIFYHSVQERYDESMSGRVRFRVEHRYYFHDGRLIRVVRAQRPPGGDDLSRFDPELDDIHEGARVFAACAAAAGGDPPECVAPRT